MLPEFLELWIDPRATNHECPELPTEAAVDSPIPPKSTRQRHRRCCFDATEFALDLVLKILENTRNGNDHRDPILANKAHDFGGMDLAGERHRAFEKYRREEGLRLSEHVAQR